MRTLIVYESIHGNTKAVAEASACGLGGDTALIDVGAASTEVSTEISLLLVGAPTYGLGLSWPRHRSPGEPGIREWMTDLVLPSTTAVATFGTHVGSRRISTTSSAHLARMLPHAGAPVITAPVSFELLGRIGPLRDGEWARARRWGGRLAAMIAPALEAARAD